MNTLKRSLVKRVIIMENAYANKTYISVFHFMFRVVSQSRQSSFTYRRLWFSSRKGLFNSKGQQRGGNGH